MRTSRNVRTNRTLTITLAVCMAAFAATLSSPAMADDLATLSKDPFFQHMKPVFGRGVNMGNALEAPKEGAWGVTLKDRYFADIAQAGFNNVRIPVRWSTHADPKPPYRIDPKFFARVDWAVQEALQRRLLPVLNIHHYTELDADPDHHRARFLGLWAQIAEHYKSYPHALALELYNEPHDKLTAEKWNRLAAEALTIVRRTNPTRDVVIGPDMWNSVNALAKLQLPENDRHIIVTFHYYEPFHFTHQGASWVGPDSQHWRGTTWNGTPAERAAMARDFDQALTWGVKHHRPLYLGEFGAFSAGDLPSRARWTHCVATEALRRKIGFAYWEFCSGFGLYDPQHDRWIEPLKDAVLK
jgi:endoglucanase